MNENQEDSKSMKPAATLRADAFDAMARTLGSGIGGPARGGFVSNVPRYEIAAIVTGRTSHVAFTSDDLDAAIDRFAEPLTGKVLEYKGAERVWLDEAALDRISGAFSHCTDGLLAATGYGYVLTDERADGVYVSARGRKGEELTLPMRIPSRASDHDLAVLAQVLRRECDSLIPSRAKPAMAALSVTQEGRYRGLGFAG